MNSQTAGGDDQRDLWNGVVGKAWVDQQDLLDTAFGGFERLLVREVLQARAAHVLDIGCGTGATAVAIDIALESRGNCTGIDLSQQMIAAARLRARASESHARFIAADAAAYDFGAERFDMIVSRFGVMFFDDPIAAFTNLRRAASAGAQLRLISWRSPEQNPFMTTAERAAAPLLAGIPMRVEGPGQFAFAQEDYVRRILRNSGWRQIELLPIDIRCRFPASRLRDYVANLGPLGRILPTLDETSQGEVVNAAVAAFEPFVDDDEVTFTAACWLISAANTSIEGSPR